jgi:hypothetical protein
MADILRYPKQFLSEESDYMSISIFEYKRDNTPGTLNDSALQGQLSQGLAPGSKVLVGTVFLPIPTELSDTKGVDWGSSNLNALQAAGIEGLDRAMTTDDFLGALQNVGDTVGNVAGLAAKSQVEGNLITKSIASSIVSSIGGGQISLNQLTSRTNGVVLNPNMEMLFNGPQIRNFTFNWPLTPRSSDEAAEIKQIIRLLKKSSSPSTGGDSGGIFLKTPDIYQISFKKGGSAHPFLFSMKAAAMTSIQVNYTAGGTYATYDNGTPVMMNLSLSFSELAPVYKEDYTDAQQGVGF